jgi:predicted nucleotidyltransferase/DNA-binding transcriptional ArsR family regulator
VFENRGLADLAVGRSTVRQRILALLMAEPGARLHLRAIQRRADTSPGTASRELTKLVSAGLIEREAEGNQVYFRASTSPLATMLRSLLVTAPAPSSASTAPPVAGIGPAVAPRVVGTPPAADGATAPAEAPAEDVAGAEAGVMIAPRVVRPGIATPPREPVTVAGGIQSGSKVDPLGFEAGAIAAAQMRLIYRERLRGVYLYGQRASGAGSPDSDVELLVVLDRIERYGEELDRTSTICASLSLVLGVVVSRIFVTETDWRGRTDGQLPRVRAEAVSL